MTGKIYFTVMVIFLILLCILMVSIVPYGAYKQNQGKILLEEKFPEGSIVTIRNSVNKYIVVDVDYKWFFDNEISNVVLVSPEQGVKLIISSDDVEIQNGNK